MTAPQSVLYCICFERRFFGANGRHPQGAKHYVGIALDGDAERRFVEHVSGQGSPLVRAVVEAGITVRLTASSPATASASGPGITSTAPASARTVAGRVSLDG